MGSSNPRQTLTQDDYIRYKPSLMNEKDRFFQKAQLRLSNPGQFTR